MVVKIRRASVRREEEEEGYHGSDHNREMELIGTTTARAWHGGNLGVLMSNKLLALCRKKMLQVFNSI
jgi:hypothetical protein